jgi:hypothetical protein
MLRDRYIESTLSQKFCGVFNRHLYQRPSLPTMETIRQLVDDTIEKELSNQLRLIGRTEKTCLLLGELIEIFYRKGDLNKGEYLRPGLDIIMPKIAKAEDPQVAIGDQELVERIFKACEFAGHYYSIRDVIFYSFALPQSIKWNQKENEIEIEVLDKTIFRQIVGERLIFFMNSKKTPYEALDKVKLLYFTLHRNVQCFYGRIGN